MADNKNDMLEEFDGDMENIIIMNDENGDEVRFEFLDLIEYESRVFVVLLPCDEDGDEVVILEVEEMEDGEIESYASVEDEALLMKIFEIFKERFKDEFNFED